MNTIVGHCPKCGAPIYAPSMWHGITPPPSQYSCSCFPNNNKTYTSTGTDCITKIQQGSLNTELEGRDKK